MFRIIFIFFASISIAASLNAQSNVDITLQSIEKNNKALKANQQLWEAKKAEFSTGLYPANPIVSYDYLFGSEVAAGYKSGFGITQSFDFPTVYVNKNELSDLQIALTEHQYKSFRQGILLQAKILCLELIYLNKRHSVLKSRLDNSEQLHNNFQLKYKHGGSGILDVNKAKLDLLNVNNDIRINEIDREQIIGKLAELNGGIWITLPDTIFPAARELPEFDKYPELVEKKNPDMKIFSNEIEVSRARLALSKSLWYPKFEVGYRSESEGGFNFNGISLGVSIPLFENFNMVKSSEAEMLFHEMQLENYKNKILFELRLLYDKALNLKASLDEYSRIFTPVNNLDLLKKSLEIGHISSIEYYMEISFFYDMYNKYLMLEKGYHLAIAELMKYDL